MMNTGPIYSFSRNVLHPILNFGYQRMDWMTPTKNFFYKGWHEKYGHAIVDIGAWLTLAFSIWIAGTPWKLLIYFSYAYIPYRCFVILSLQYNAFLKILAMESTGVYWRPVHNVIEGFVEVILVNARHIKNVPGRKTDIT